MDFLVFASMSVARVFVCSTRKAAKFISVVFLLFLPAIVFASGRCLTREVRVSR